MAKVQFIRTPKGESLAVLPRAEYEALAKAADRYDRAQLRAVERRIKEGREKEYPFAVVEAVADGLPPVRAWREDRALSATAVAEAAGISAGYLSQIETGRRTGTLRVLQAIADVIGVTVTELTAPLEGD